MRALGLLLVVVSAALAADESSTEGQLLGISKGKFVVRGVPTFLLGISYFDGMSAPTEILESDLSFLKARGFNAIRVWATWYDSVQPRTFPLIHRNGTLNSGGWRRLERLLDAAQRKNFIVDLTFSREAIRPISFEDYRKGIRSAAVKLKPYPYIILDLQNESNDCGTQLDPDCDGHLSLQQVALVRSDVKRVSPQRLVTASRNAFRIQKGIDDYQTFRSLGKVDFIATHRPPRTVDGLWALETDDEVRLARRAIGDAVPVLFDEPNRCGRTVVCTRRVDMDLFLTAAAKAKRAGAAGWFFHTDAGFLLHRRSLVAQLHFVERAAVDRLGERLGLVTDSLNE